MAFTTLSLTPITKREARRRYDSGQRIAVGQTKSPAGTPGATFTKREMGGKTFDEVAEMSVDTRRPSSVFWSAPQP